MSIKRITWLLVLSISSLLCLIQGASAQINPTVKPQRDPNQAIDEEYTKKIGEYTTEKF